MQDPASPSGPPSEADRLPDALRVQILTSEHWSLLATRTMTWNETLTRAGMFLTVLSAATVALALVAQATEFGSTFRLFALFVLPVVLGVGFLTFLRLGDASDEDRLLVVGMNRLRHAYLELAPELEPYFVTGHTDDEAGILRTYGSDFRIRPSRVLASSPALVGILNVVVSGILGALAARSFDATDAVVVATGIAAAMAVAAGLSAMAYRDIHRVRRGWRAQFPRRGDGS